MRTFLRAPFLLALALATGAAALPGAAHATGAWTTYIHMVTTNDILALPDTVWLASGEAGLLRYLRSSDTFESITREPGGLASNSVTALAFDRSGRLWAGTAGKGVSRLAATGGTWDLVNAFDGLPSDSVNVLRADGDTIWIGTTRGIALWNGTQVAGSVPDLGTPSPFRHDGITGIVVDGDSLFVATLNGLYLARLSESLANWTDESAGIATSEIDGLAIWHRQPFALAGGLVYAWNGGGWTATTVSGAVDKLRDDFGTLLAVSPNGLFQWDGLQWNAIPAAWGSGSGATVTEMAADPSGQVFETHAQALLEHQGAAWVTHHPEGPVDNDVQNVLHDGTRLWAATFSGGVSMLDAAGWHTWHAGCCGPGQDTSFVDPSFAFTLQRGAAGDVWISTWGRSMERIDPTTTPFTFEHVYQAFGLAPSDTNSAHTWGWSSAVDPWGYVLVGGDTPDRGGLEPMGVDVYAPDGTRAITWKTTNAGLRSNQVRAL
ncbi:MAG TPA: two-component regulator propeller domain-containing protein, partial [Dongiaceae bacterium]|nr:two-component regulator propeller domain-containing protein [Dongiaceae bacterium]